jgi:hypothetical protein
MVVTCSSSGAKELPWVVCKLKRASLQYDYAGTLPHDALLSSVPEGLSDSTGESLSSCSAFSAWASSASIFFSIESRWFSRAAAVCSPRWSSLKAFRDIRIHSYTCVVEPTWARSASDCGPAPAPFCSFDMVEVICGVVVVVAWKTSATLEDDEAQALARSHLGNLLACNSTPSLPTSPHLPPFPLVRVSYTSPVLPACAHFDSPNRPATTRPPCSLGPTRT